MNGERRTTFALRRDPTEVKQARQLVARACDGLARDLVEIAQLLTTELVTNAIEHGSGPVTLGICRSDSDLRIEVRDATPDRPRASVAPLDQVRGRGLLLVESMAAGWGVECPEDGGKSVWFRLRVRAPASSAGR
jgi:anti-sigma regulatory factor (Ser/Thr protein kinase)